MPIFQFESGQNSVNHTVYIYIDFFLIGEKKNDRKGNAETGNARKENGGIGKDGKGNAKKKLLGISSTKI